MVLLCARAPLLCLLGLIWVLTAYLLGNCRFYRVSICRFFSRVFLSLFGIYKIQLREYMVKIGPKYLSASKLSPSWSIVPNRSASMLSLEGLSTSDWIISNHTSYLDAFVLSTIFSPVFYSLDQTSTTDSEAKGHSLWSYFLAEFNDACMIKRPLACTNVDNVSLPASTKDGPKAFFPEKTTGNGKGLLRFDHSMDQLFLQQLGQRVFICVLKYPATEELSPVFVHGRIWWHMLSLLTRFKHSAEILILPLSDYHLLRTGMCSDEPHVAQYETSQTLAYIMSLFGKIKPTSLNWTDKIAFMDYYQSRQKESFYFRTRK